jgi:hypothetical protein
MVVAGAGGWPLDGPDVGLGDGRVVAYGHGSAVGSAVATGPAGGVPGTADACGMADGCALVPGGIVPTATGVANGAPPGASAGRVLSGSSAEHATTVTRTAASSGNAPLDGDRWNICAPVRRPAARGPWQGNSSLGAATGRHNPRSVSVSTGHE